MCSEYIEVWDMNKLEVNGIKMGRLGVTLSLVPPPSLPIQEEARYSLFVHARNLPGFFKQILIEH